MTIDPKQLTNFAVRRGISPSSGHFFNLHDGSKGMTPIKVRRMTYLGTQSQYGADEEKAAFGNPITGEVAFLDEDTDTLAMTTSVLFYRDPDTANIEMSNIKEAADLIKAVSDAYAKAGGFNILGRMYAENIAYGAPLWRNKGVFGVDTRVKVRSASGNKQTFNFSNTDADKVRNKSLDELGKHIGEGLSGITPMEIQITYFSKIGYGQEVFPSQEMIIAGPGARASKVLDKNEDNQALMHPWKIGNAIRRIDVWHPAYDEVGVIPVEVYGTVTRHRMAYRYGSRDFYRLLSDLLQDKRGVKSILKASKPKDLDKIEDAHYFMAVLVRGGVFGMSEK